jgi:spore germination protein YaaH
LTRFIPVAQSWNGRPAKDRYAIACAFLAKTVYNLPTTTKLLEKLAEDEQLRRICGWRYPHQVPHSSTFSRAFAEFALLQLPQMVHEALVRETQKERLIAHIARDSTAMAARERFPETAPEAPKPAPPVKVSR